MKDQPNIFYKIIPDFVDVIVQLLLDGAEVHGLLDHLLVGGELLGVDGVRKGPGVV